MKTLFIILFLTINIYSQDSVKVEILINLERIPVLAKSQLQFLIDENLRLKNENDSLDNYITVYKENTRYFFDTVLVKTQAIIDTLIDLRKNKGVKTKLTDLEHKKE